MPDKKSEKKDKCDCVFCNSKCPECGSEQVSVRFLMGYEYNNDTHNELCFGGAGTYVKLKCHGCEKVFDYGNIGFSPEYDDYDDADDFDVDLFLNGNDGCLKQLWTALRNDFGTRINIKYNDDKDEMVRECYTVKTKTMMMGA